MSKMSQLHAELSERASELGFETLQQALDNGYHINYRNKDTVELMKRQGYEEEEQEKAHKAWLEERDALLKDLGFEVPMHFYTYDFAGLDRAVKKLCSIKFKMFL